MLSGRVKYLQQVLQDLVTANMCKQVIIGKMGRVSLPLAVSFINWALKQHPLWSRYLMGPKQDSLFTFGFLGFFL